MSNSALASLTAQYTDSENEEEHRKSPDSENSQTSVVIIPSARQTPQQSPENHKSNGPPKKKRKSKGSVKRLVSYQDDTIVSDDEQDDKEEDNGAETLSSESEDHNVIKIEDGNTPLRNGISPIEIDDDSGEDKKSMKINSKDKYAKYKHYSFTLPPEPKSKPLPELTEKINQLYEKMDTNNMDMNRIIQQRKEFRNPSIYEKLIQFCDINEFGTNYPPEIYDPLQWGSQSYYEELALVQKNEMLKRQKEKKDSGKIEQVSALARKVEEEAKKRKSKWDQPASTAKSSVPAPLTTTVTGTKGTVISAFGSLPKKTVV